MALILAAVGDLSASGGTERQFSEAFEYLHAQDPAHFTLITSSEAHRRLREAGRTSGLDGVVTLPLGRHPARGRVAVLRLTAALLWAVWRGRYDVVHICQPTPVYVPFAWALRWWPRPLRPRLVLTIVDCTLVPNLRSGCPEDLYEQQVLDAHRMYFRWARIDGVYSWYRDFIDLARADRLLPSPTPMVAARYCFANTARFGPSPKKEPLIVFAGRFSKQKRPLLFVDAITALVRRHPGLADEWLVEMYGKGPLEREVHARIAAGGLEDRIKVTSSIDMAPVFARSALYVSTQQYENFTSLAMLEAMAAGNAVVAEDAGQTQEFVLPGANGLLVPHATPEALADAIAEYIRRPDRHAAMAAESRRLATEVHTIEHFAADITAFWSEVCAQS